MLPDFFYHPRMMAYDFGEGHPLKPERLRRFTLILEQLGIYKPIDPGPGSIEDILRVHEPGYVEAIRRHGTQSQAELSMDEKIDLFQHGLGTLDVPVFRGMFEASLAYVAGSAEAARAVRDGSRLAFGMAGGLHHALRDKSAGFCIFNDCAIACHILRERFDRVAYVDIDVHQGDGVQWIFFDDASVLTCSIHEDPKTLWPGTGAVDETNETYTALNVPLIKGTTGDVWLDAFKRTIIPALNRYEPGAIVLQMGADSHALDPLAHLQNDVGHWLRAIEAVRDLEIPIVALGGGGYNLHNVPRMWTAACLTLVGRPVPEFVPEPHTRDWGPTFLDPQLPVDQGVGRSYAEHVIDYIDSHHLRSLNPRLA